MLETLWDNAVRALGGRPGTAGDLSVSYAGRAYHNADHVLAVVRDVTALAEGRSEDERAVLVLAALAHDVVYDGQPGEDERRSAEWARERLFEAGVEPDRVVALVLATVDHSSDDDLALVLLDADLAVLGSSPEEYERYRAAVRREYAHVSDEAWRVGRARVLEALHARDPLFRTDGARDRWESRAKANLAAELATLQRETRGS